MFAGICRLAAVCLLLRLAQGVALAEDGGQSPAFVPLESMPGEFEGHGPGFTRVPLEAAGVSFANVLAPDRYVTNQILLNGSGVALGDVDLDGWCDILLPALGGPNALLRNLGGWRFTNIADHAGVALPGLDCTGAVLGDLDGDGRPDLLINTVGQGTHVLLNSIDGVFRPAPGSPFNPGRGGMSACIADIDGDGDLDIFIANYRADTFRDQPGTRFRGRNVGGRMVLHTVNGRPVTEPDLAGRYSIDPSGVIVEHGEPNLLLVNQGNGRFVPEGVDSGRFMDASRKALPVTLHDWSLSAAFRDLNGDGAPDLYVCNDFQSPDGLWFNDGNGRFHAAPVRALPHMPMYSMGIDFADLNHDGHDDFIVADMLGSTHEKRHTQLGELRPPSLGDAPGDQPPQYSFNQLFLARGDGSYAEIGWFAGVTATDWTWAPVFLDVDLDGLPDLLFSTGNELAAMDADIGFHAENLRRSRQLPRFEVLRLKLLYPRANEPNMAFRNLGDLRFAEATDAWRFGLPLVTTGIALGDLDNDGDLDVVLNNLNDPVALLRNDAVGPRLSVELRGAPPNTHGVGARLLVRGGPAPQSREVMLGSRYLSSDQARFSFAARDGEPAEIEIRWRGGAVTRCGNLTAGRHYVFHEPERADPPERARHTALFKEAPAALRHVHSAEGIDDFAAQPLLPAALHRMTPGVLCSDLNGDGADDLAIGDGSGAIVFLNRGGILRPARELPRTAQVIHGMVPAHGSGLGGLLLARTQPASLPAVEFIGDGTNAMVLRGLEACPGALATTDFDGDGDLDLFVAGRWVRGRYPAPADSMLLRGEPSGLRADEEGTFARIGLVTGATWADLADDGFPDLVLATEWGPLRIFRNTAGRMEEWDPEIRGRAGDSFHLSGAMRLSELTGCWNSVAPVDLDGDGRVDLVAGNWGLNSRWQLAGSRPLRLYLAEFGGALQTLEAVFVPELGEYAPVRSRRAIAPHLPFVTRIAPSHAAFARTTIPRIAEAAGEPLPHVEARLLASVVLLNRGDAFEVRALPPEAQWSPVFAIVPADFDGDGHEDLFLGQNHFGVHPDAARQDSGCGLVLRGDGTGGLAAMSVARSGIHLPGEHRGAVTGDFNGDRRPDLVVTRHADSTRLFENVGARPGLRVRLQGPPGNPTGIGATVRVEFGERMGPARPVDGGSGWLSLNSPTLILGISARPTAVRVRWPGGHVTRTAVREDAMDVTVRWDGGRRPDLEPGL